MTLPELLIGVVILGMITATLAASISVVLRQHDNTEGRLNVARGEQQVGVYLPADLASAESVDIDPAASPCGSSCPPGLNVGGSNALLLTWTTQEAGATGPVTAVTKVSYRYVQEGDEYQLIRVECRAVGGGAPECSMAVMLHGVDPPPQGTPWVPGTTVPSWVMQVSIPTDPADTGSGSTVPVDPGLPTKGAQRVVVTINGGGDFEGAGGGRNQITLTAGGTQRQIIDARSVTGTPSFAEARSRCGGPITLVIDTSGSIGSSMTQVRQGVRRFVEAFAGTPVQLNLVGFSTTSRIVDGAGWTGYHDMTDQAAVASLLAAVDGMVSNGGTNWEDAMYRAFLNADGTVQAIIPNQVVFFTDGVPTYSRRNYRASPGILPADPPPAPPGWPYANGSQYNQEAFDRADYIVRQFRSSVDLVGVGVGSGISGSSSWLSGGDGWHYEYFRGYHWTYQRGYHRTDGVNYYSAPYTSWQTVTLSQYNANNRTDDSSDGWRRTASYTSPYDLWEPTTYDLWYANRSSSGWKRDKVYAEPYTDYDAPTSTSTPNATILTRLIAGNDFGVPALSSGGRYVNADEANMYILPDWGMFTGALEAVALAECGGTLTLQTKVGGTPAADPFIYQNTAIASSSGAPMEASLEVVTTTRQFTTGTFDFSIADGSFVTVEIQPQNLSDLVGYAPVGWSCRAGVQDRSYEAVPIPGSSWTGVRVRVASNEAVACTLSVRRV